MAFLTSHIDPDDTSARDDMVTFWSRAVTHAFERTPCLAVGLGELMRASLTPGGSVTPGIELAMAHMVELGQLVQRSEFEVKVKILITRSIML